MRFRILSHAAPCREALPRLYHAAPRQAGRALVAGIFLAVATLAAPGMANAATTNANLTSTATVPSKCIISSSTALAFGTYDPVNANRSTPKDATATVSVQCSKYSLSANVGVGLQSAATTQCATKQMKSSSGKLLAYNTYRDTARTQVLGCKGDGGAFWLDFNTLNTGAAQDVPVYGRIAAGLTAEAGSYTDTLNISLTF